ncbi:MAG: cell division protein FtsZ [Bacteroidetes bacterium]|nr:MAG: cell division protein FtsZ [Bacteroidota bacterium]
MQFEFPKNQNAIIKVIGVGGGGGNAVNNMHQKGIEGVDFLVCNTDLQALKQSKVPAKIRLGAEQTQGLGAGANPEIGKKAAIESLEEVRTGLKENTKMVFITAGMGGGTGTGAAPVLANMCKEMGILTVGIVTTPFRFEGPRRAQQAAEGLLELQKVVDTLIVIDNNNLQKILGSKISMKKAFAEADQVLCNAAKGIAEIITTEGYINVDFADVCTIMKDGGKALMGTAVAEGEDRAMQAVEAAINSPLLDNIGVEGARGIVVNITASEDSLGMDETTSIVEHVQQSAGNNANIIYGIVYDEEMGDQLRVTVIATRFEDADEEELVAHLKETAQPKQQATAAAVEEPRPIRRETLRRLDRKEREERIKKLNSKVYDIHDPESLQGLEAVPAYMRKQVPIGSDGQQEPRLSRLSLEEDEEKKYRLKENNTFLHDNVD